MYCFFFYCMVKYIVKLRYGFFWRKTKNNNINYRKDFFKMKHKIFVFILAVISVLVMSVSIIKAVTLHSRLSDANNTIAEITLVEGKDVPSSDNSNSGKITVNLNTWIIIDDLDDVAKSSKKSGVLMSSIFEDLYSAKVISAMKDNLVTLKYTNKITIGTYSFYVVAGNIITAPTTAKG